MSDIEHPYIDTEPLEIVRRTHCKLHNHVFIWTSSGLQSEVPKHAECDCGKWTWHDLLEAKGIVAKNE